MSDVEVEEICGVVFRGSATAMPIICTRDPHDPDPMHAGLAPATWYEGGKTLYVVGS